MDTIKKVPTSKKCKDFDKKEPVSFILIIIDAEYLPVKVKWPVKHEAPAEPL